MSDLDSEITLKLLFDAENNKVLFAEAGEDFIDFMLIFLFLPFGAIIDFVTPRTTFGSIGKLFQSVEKIRKSTLFQPRFSPFAGACPVLRTWTGDTPQPKKTHNCTHCHRSIDCTSTYNANAGTGNGGNRVEGFVKVTYMITDDLEVTPMSAISSITLMNRFILEKNVRLEEKTVVVGKEEGLALFEASLKSATAFTDVFLNFWAKKSGSSV